MKLKKTIMALTILLLIGGPSLVSMASAADFACTLTGYTFMGGASAYSSSGGSNQNDDYFLAQPLTYMYGTNDMWGYAWIKFANIGTETVDAAYLTLDLLGVGGMAIEDACEEYPGTLNIFSPGTTDVAGLADDSDLRSTLRNTLYPNGAALLETVTMTSNGIYTIDITHIYNAWVTGEVVNNGIVLVSYSENSSGALGSVGTKYASTSGDLGTAPYITTVDNSISAPTVSGAHPENNAREVGVDTIINVAFDKDMNTCSVEAAFSMTPTGNAASVIDGAFSWNESNTVMTFSPTGLLAHETTYSVAVGSDAADVTGNTLESNYAFSFTTGAYVAPSPQIAGSPSGTVSVDTASLTISGNGVFAYRYSLDDDAWSDAYVPSRTLALNGLSDGEHALNIQVRDSLGAWTNVDTITWTVMTPPRVVSVTPRNEGAASVIDSVTVTFSEAMNRQSAEDAFSISPQVEGSFSWDGETILFFTPSTILAGETQYTVTIADTAADTAGNTLSSLHAWTFTTLSARSVRCSATADTYVMFGGMGNGKGYPQGTSMGEYKLKAGAVTIVDARILMRFDLTPLADLELTAEDIESAYLVYTMVENSDGMDVGPPAPDSTAMYGFIHVLDTETREKTGETVDAFFWNEAVTGSGYTDMSNKPWYPAGSPWVLASHATGTGTTGRVDIVSIVKGWLDGRWENNGIELRDQDDQSYINSSEVYGGEYGDGYSWHLASREDSLQGPYLLVTYNSHKLRIVDQTASSAAMEPQSYRDLTASGGSSGDFHWTVVGPGGDDVSENVLSASTGATVTFTPPNDPGLYTVAISSGSEATSISIGVGTAYSNNARAPLFMDTSRVTAERQSVLNDICYHVLFQLGRCDSLGRIELVDAQGRINIGGTGLDNDARVVIAVIDDPSMLNTSTTVSLDGVNGRIASMEIFADSLANNTGTLYAVVADTGRDSFGKASGVFIFSLYNENGDELADEALNRLKLTIPFDATGTGASSLENGDWLVRYSDTLTGFFSVDNQSVDTNAIVVNGHPDAVTFETSHCSVFGLFTQGNGTTTADSSEASDELGAGCFINVLSENGEPVSR
jgi:hypothetical protein